MPIRLGGGGSSALPINSIAPMNTTDPLYTEANGSQWLRSGTVSNDINEYPLAAKSFGAYFNKSFSVGGQETNPTAITWDGSFFYVIGAANIVHKYAPDGTFIEAIPTSLSTITGMAWDGTNFWMATTSGNRIHKVDSAFNFTGDSVAVGNQVNTLEGVAFDGTHLWALDKTGAGSDSSLACIYQYDLDGNYTGVSFNYGAQSGNGWSFAYAAGSLWVATGNGRVLEISPAAGLTGESFSISASSDMTIARGLAFDGTSLWALNVAQANVLAFEKHVGMLTRKTDSDSEKPLYVRVA
ncbi:hypothetical protein [Marinobacter sp. NFXS9]|uniref:hypothetical protein n=1 Tax=Marinobacter sp. NFXS9 TaxID=2818433 RepID=UPI0032DF3053